eukprot:14766404-Heterocapsa_arctica.AAC.1
MLEKLLKESQKAREKAEIETFKGRRNKEIKHGRVSKMTVTYAIGADSQPGDWVCPACRVNVFVSNY